MTYQATCMTRFLEFAEKGGLDLTLTMVVDVVGLEDLIETFE